MGAPHVSKIGRRRNATRKDGRGGRGGLTALLAIASGLTIAYLITPQWMMDRESVSRTVGQGGTLPVELRTGSIFIASMNQDSCRQHSFDNVTGAQWDLGVVDCRDAILQSRQGPSMDRMNAITDAFRQK
jgi:hypothetical protein